MSNESFIQRTFELAKKSLGSTWPNPLVGAVIVKNGEVIGEGFHQKYGGPHAEIEALNQCKVSPEGSIVYVNLEPCCHTNKQTPPCAQRLIKEKVKKVVIANLDPNPQVLGKGVELLRSHGIEVEHGILAEEGEKLNEVFFTAQRKQRPFVHLKLATTLDGKIALPSGESKWITSEASREKVQEFRSQSQAILIGAETLRKDNPALTLRLKDYQRPQPYRVVFTQSGKLYPDFHLFQDQWKDRTLVYSHRELKLDGIHTKVVSSLEEALQDLFQRKIINVFLEGGATLASAFIRRKLVDRVSLFMNPSFLGAGKNALDDFGLEKLSERPYLKDINTQSYGGDFFITGRL